MPEVPTDPKGFSLRRWSQRKHAAAREGVESAAAGQHELQPAAKDAASPRAEADSVLRRPAATIDDGSAPVRADSPMSATAAIAEPDALPALDTLTIDSDYSPFMQPGVDDAVKRGALKKLFADPRFNVMDGLDVYIDDYSKPDPIDPAIVRTLVQARYLFNPPATRVNAQGHVEDVADEPTAEPVAADAGAAAPSGDDAVRSALPDGASVAERSIVPAPSADAMAAVPAVPTVADPDTSAADSPPVRER
jgi:hypothetical protein